MTPAAALFTGEGVPLHDASMPVLNDLGTVICTRPICHVLFGLDDPDALQRGDVDLIYLLPMGSGRARLIDGQEVGVNALNLLRQALSQMGATPADATRVPAGSDDEPDRPEDKYFN